MRIHCIGIGGIGVSALAQYYLEQGHSVSGSDLAASEITDFLVEKGVKILIGNTAEHIAPDVDVVIHSPAVRKDNPEMLRAAEYKITTKSYPEALGELTRKYFTIAVAGSHGKSTTTSMLGLLLAAAGLDPTVIVGTKLKEFGNSNFRMGRSRYLVIEACEYDGSFLEYSPQIAIITNIDKEHLDYFKTFANVKKAFKDFAKKLPPDGFLVTEKMISAKDAKKLHLQIPGKHNVSNALMALAVARHLGVDDKISFAALNAYRGSWRRFEVVKTQPYTVISDYGHHPNEVAATLQAAREKYGAKKIWCIFQPHQHQRTHYLFGDFVRVFKKATTDRIIITDIYDVAGREVQDINASVSAQALAEKIGKKSVAYMPVGQAEAFVKEHIKRGEVLIIMGAGNIYKIVDDF